MTGLVRAAVKVGPRKLEVQEFPKPAIGPDDGLLRLERCGICGSDVEQYHRAPRPGVLEIPGHEPLGIIEEIGERAAARWGVQPGDRVAVVRGGMPPPARIGEGTPLRGSYAEYLFLTPAADVRKVRNDIPADIAVMYNPLGAGVRWIYHLGGVGLGSTVLILGCGQRGLTSVMVAKAVGAATIIVTGLERDGYKLALARELGADYTINVEKENTVERVREITNGVGVDVALDVAPVSVQPTLDAIEATRHGGRVVLAGLKGENTFPFNNRMLIGKGLTMVGAFTVDVPSYEEAIKMIETNRFPLEKLHTHTFSLDEANLAVETLAGEVEGEEAIHVSIDPFA